MYQIDIYKSIQRQTDKIREYVELAMKIHQVPVTRKSAEDLAEILDMVQKRADHLIKQLDKGIAYEKELEEVYAMAKNLPETEIYVFMTNPSQGIDQQNKPN